MRGLANDQLPHDVDYTPYEGQRVNACPGLTLSRGEVVWDGSAALEIVHWLKSPLPVDIGASVECTGTVDLYRGRLQLRLWTPKDLQVLSP